MWVTGNCGVIAMCQLPGNYCLNVYTRVSFVNVVVFILRRPLDYYTMELSEHAEGLSDL